MYIGCLYFPKIREWENVVLVRERNWVYRVDGKGYEEMITILRVYQTFSRFL